jgi:RNA polymerase sigma factor (sigma-70 family)
MKRTKNNFSRYKEDVKKSQPEGKFWDEYTRDELIVKFLPLVENIARKFKDGDAASGVMSLSDRIQFGSIGLVKAIDKIEWKTIITSRDSEKTLKSYLAKRIRGAIRRASDSTRSGIRIPEHKMNDIRNNFEQEENSMMFYNAMLDSIDKMESDDNYYFQIPDESESPMKLENLCVRLLSLMKEHLNEREFEVVRLSYGLGCDKLSAKQIAAQLNMQGSSSYVRVSQLKKQAIDKLKQHLDHSQVLDYL